MAKKVQEATVKVTGTLIEFLGTVSKANWSRHDFTIQNQDGTTNRCSTFGKFNSELVGEDVQFDATYDEKYKNYNVKSDIEVISLGEEPPKAVQAPLASPRASNPVTHRYSKPTASQAVEQEVTGADSLNETRSSSEEVFKQDVEFVKSLVPANQLGAALQAFQAIRATILISAQKYGNKK
jgi:hypothetical protein